MRKENRLSAPNGGLSHAKVQNKFEWLIIGQRKPMTKRVSEFSVFLSPQPLMARWKHNPDPQLIAETLGCSVPTVYKYLKNERNIHFTAADRYAIRLGLHPVLIWGEEWISPSLPSLKPRGRKKKVESPPPT